MRARAWSLLKLEWREHPVSTLSLAFLFVVALAALPAAFFATLPEESRDAAPLDLLLDDETVLLVGPQVAPGTYRTVVPTDVCHWSIHSDTPASFDNATVMKVAYEGWVETVTIDPTDRAFSSEGCGAWMSDLGALRPDPAAALSLDGSFFVGSEVAPGVWRNDKPRSFLCFWQRTAGFRVGDVGSADRIEEIPGDSRGMQTVRIMPTDRGFRTEDCGVWTRIAD